MKFMLDELDFEKELSSQLISQFHNLTASIIKGNRRDSKDLSKVKLFHGTTLRHLNSIFKNGLLPRKESNLEGNYAEHLSSNENLVYLTDKWHYLYANLTYRKTIEDAIDKDINIQNLPCYVEFEVRIQDLLIDEDFFHSKYVKEKIISTLRKKSTEMKLTAMECLERYGTVAHIGEIEHFKIISFTILGDYELFVANILNASSKYAREVESWRKGEGKGTLTSYDLALMENTDDSKQSNLTFWLKDIRENDKDIVSIDSFIAKEDNEPGIGKYRIKFSLEK